jgi:aspartate aminotransferase
MNEFPGFVRAERIGAIAVSEIIRIGADARKRAAAGHPVITLAAGEPDFPTPDNVKLAGMQAILANDTRYTALDGTLALKNAIRDKFLKENGLSFAIDEISVGAGAKQVLYNVLMATVNPGDEVIVALPCWTSYLDMVRITGGVPVACACPQEDGFRLTPQRLAAAITPRTRWLLLNSPANPTGAVYGAQEIAALGAVLRASPHVGIISDDIYEHIRYDEDAFATMAAVCPDLRARTVTINGVSKAYSMTGWRIGYAAAPRDLIAAMAEALLGAQEIVRHRRDAFRVRRDAVVAGLNAIPGVQCATPGGAFYAFANVGALLAHVTEHTGEAFTDSMLCHHFLQECDVAVVPGSCFGTPGFIRLSYAASDEALRAALVRMTSGAQALMAR